MTIKMKLLGALGTLSLMIALLGIYSYVSLTRLELQNTIYSDIARADNYMYRARLSQADYLLLRETEFKEQVDTYLDNVRSELAHAQSLMAVESSIKRVEAIKEDVEKYRNLFIEMANSGKPISINEMQPIMEAAQSAADGSESLLNEEYEISSQVRGNVTLTITSAVLVALVISVGLGFWLIKSIMTPLIKTMKMAEAISDGDLTQNVEATSNDEFGSLIQALNTSTEKLHNIIQEIKNVSSKLSVTGETVENSVLSANESMQKQRDEAESLITKIKNLAESSKLIANRCDHASDNSASAREQSMNGDATVQKANTGMVSLSDELKNATTSVTKLDNDSKNVADILSVIRSIAEQTNLLALNAAIEAARAGDQGRGFAVVADEVRTLAARTGDSTEEITSIIDIIQSGASEVVSVIETSNIKGQNVIDLNAEASEAYTNISESINKIAQDNSDMAKEAKDQLALTEKTKENVENIFELFNANSQALKDVAEQIKVQANERQALSELVGFFKV